LPLLGAVAESLCVSAVLSAITEKSRAMSLSRFVSRTSFIAIVAFAPLAIAGVVHADNSIEIPLSYKDKKFDPPEINAPANIPIVIKFRNLDTDAMELESDSLHIEKVVAAGKEATIKVKAQKSGRYEFFDEYNEKTARGALVVK
jgi:Cupredoxin-like domain